VASIPDVYNLWSILYTNTSAQFIWSFYGICQSLLANPTSMAPADVQRRANVRQRTIDDNNAIAAVCAQYAHCRHDGFAGFNTAFTTSHVSTLDYFHPSVAGEALIAQVAWDNFWDFTEVTPPVSDSSATMAPGNVTVSLSATDDVAVSGIEYKIGTGAYTTYSAPVTVPAPATFTWRAVDVNGNSEATHTCYLGGWNWPPGDADCDGFADTAFDPVSGRASEAAISTLAGAICAANTTPNNEPPPDAWPVDLNDSRNVTGPDLLAFGAVFGGIAPDPPYSARFDLSGDGKITGPDLLKFGPFFGLTCG
jgi:hypothetical protein